MANWHKLAAEAGGFAHSTNPLRDMKTAGIEIDPRIHALFDGRVPAFKLDPVQFERLVSEFGGLPEVRVAIADPDRGPPGGPSDFGATITLDSALVNEVTKAFWDARAYRPRIPASIIRKVFEIAPLRLLCDGIPDDAGARIGAMDLRDAATIEVPGDGFDVVIVQPMSVRIPGSQPVSLDGTIRIRLPLAADVTASRTYLAEASVQAAVVDLVVDPASVVRPRSEAAREQLGNALTQAVREELALARLLYSLPSARALSGKFENTTLGLDEMAGYARMANGRKYLTFGLELLPADAPPDPTTLVAVLPRAPENVRIVVDDRLATTVLTAAIGSGDLARWINGKFSRMLDPIDPAPIRFEGGVVRFVGGRMKISIDLVWVDACVAGKNLAAALTITALPQLANGQLGFTGIQADIDLDNTDALACTLLSALLGPLGLVANAIVLGLAAAINPSFESTSIPSFLEPALPRTELRFRVALSSLEVGEGHLVAGGVARLVPNVVDWFVYLKVLQVVDSGESILGGVRRSLAVVPQAAVSLFELDNPAPEGDDVAIPDLEPTEQVVGRYLTTVIRSYHPRADELLDSVSTDDDGLVRFRVRPNAIGGVATTHRTRELRATGQQLSHSITRDDVPEPGPDFAVSIAAADGTMLTNRLLVAPNARQKHAGTLGTPLLVVIPRPRPEPVVER